MPEKESKGIKKFFEEFKAFAMRGNVLDMAVGVVVGGAFTAIVTALVDDVINPLIGLFFKADFSDVVIGLGGSSIKIGEFVNSVINFLIVAFVLFVVIKFINGLHSFLLYDRFIGCHFSSVLWSAPFTRRADDMPSLFQTTVVS